MTRTVLWTGAALVALLCRAQNVSPADLDALKRLLSAGAQKQARDAAEQLIERRRSIPRRCSSWDSCWGLRRNSLLRSGHSRGPWMRRRFLRGAVSIWD